MSKARDLANAGTALGAVTATELAYVDGVTSAIQTQIDSKIGSASAINPTIVDAKGDIIAASAADTPARLAVGNNGETLVADSSTSTGLRYIPLNSAGKNTVINGGMDIWQRGTSVAGTTTVLLADRWNAYRAVAGSTFSRQTSGLTGFNYGLRMQRDSGNSATNLIQTLQNYETVNTIPLAGQTVTLSWYAKVGANFSPTSSQMFVQVYTGTGTDQNILNGYTGSVTLLNDNVTITTSYVRYSKTFTIASTMTEMSIVFGFNPTGTASTNDWLEITGVQLELGSVATTFSRNGGTIQGELAACQRYYWRVGVSNSGLGQGMAQATTGSDQLVRLPVTMRIAPTVLDYSGLLIGDGINAAVSFTSVTLYAYDNGVLLSGAATGLTQYRLYSLRTNSSGYMGVGAEL